MTMVFIVMWAAAYSWPLQRSPACLQGARCPRGGLS
jgi:hypothetical protein